ncbi:unnamed protein product [Didymodactylos carnosus]|uniref:Phosphoglycerate mutase-like protein n=1 Tax=Didymodactylos carnosus TaxID=1234261 RepID=A0A814Z9V0_9BILA|nr:unnamed protein product [Didymodactylos carnosus]CAF4001188.1 unnamed protein product [Didymodactylos carnosus]
MFTFQRLLGRFLGQVDNVDNSKLVIDHQNLATPKNRTKYHHSTIRDATTIKDSSSSSIVVVGLTTNLRTNETVHRSHSLSKSSTSRRNKSIEAIKSASCLTCGINTNKADDNNSPSEKLSNDFRIPKHPLNNVVPKRRAQTKLIIIRHGERVDAIFGDNWLSKAFDQVGNYIRYDPNLPSSLPHRNNLNDYLFDPPLTEIGLMRSYRTGEALHRAGLNKIDYCYSSPALRCIQTANSMLDGMKLRTTIPIRVELGLFECGLWHKNFPPIFMPINELVLNRFNIEISYDSVMKCLTTNEDELSYYLRSYHVMKKILSRHLSEELTILFVGHAPSLETLTRKLVGAEPRPYELTTISQKINYLSLTVVEGEKDNWTFVDAILSR